MILTEEMINQLPLSELPEDYDKVEEITAEIIKEFNEEADIIDAEYDGEYISLEESRQLLHKMIEEVYASHDSGEEGKSTHKAKNSFIDFKIDDIPIERLRKQYLNYSYELPFSATDFSDKMVKKGDKSTPLNEVRLMIKDRFYIDDWQITTDVHNFNDIALIVPNIPESKDMIIKAMENEGYLKADEREITHEEMSWSRILFEPYLYENN